MPKNSLQMISNANFDAADSILLFIYQSKSFYDDKLHVRSSFSKHRNECRNKDIFSWRLDEIRSIRVKHDSQKMYIVQ